MRKKLFDPLSTKLNILNVNFCPHTITRGETMSQTSRLPAPQRSILQLTTYYYQMQFLSHVCIILKTLAMCYKDKLFSSNQILCSLRHNNSLFSYKFYKQIVSI